MSTTLEEAKQRVRISDLWREFGFDGEPKKQTRCPFHEDRSPSFSVFDEDKAWKCFSGCGEGSVVDFYVKAKGISDEDACREIVRRANVSTLVDERKGRSTAVGSTGVELPPLEDYSKDIAQRVADSRGLSIQAVEFAALWLKTVVFGSACDQKCWILTDASRKCAEARRIDRKPFPAIGTLAERKSHSLRNSSKSWPVGILPAGFEAAWLTKHCYKVLLIEGGPDYLAICQLIAAQDVNVLPVAMLGASATISNDALPHFRNRDVTVVAHGDEPGRAAGMRWAKQLQAVATHVRLVTLTTGDLCDAVSQGATSKELQLL